MKETLGICSDHAGFELKEIVKQLLTDRGYLFHDFGTTSAESCDYPDFAHLLGRAIESGEYARGIAVCGTGNGMAITLNKYPSVRAGICWQPEIAHLISAHNKANILVLPGRFITKELAEKVLDEYLNTPFEGGRHQRRIDKIVDKG